MFQTSSDTVLDILNQNDDNADSIIEERSGPGVGPVPSLPDGSDVISMNGQSMVKVGYKLKDTLQPVFTQTRPSQGLSYQLWPAAVDLCTFLDRQLGMKIKGETGTPCEATGLDTKMAGAQLQLISRLSGNLRGKRVLELGSGTGLVGVVAARLGADVTVTDLPHVLENLEENLRLNQDLVAAAGGSVQAQVLRWGEESDVACLGGNYDVILGADVVYSDTLFVPLLCTLKWLVQKGGNSGDLARDTCENNLATCNTFPVVIIAHMKRWKKDSKFFKMASKWFHVEILCVNDPPEGARKGVEIFSLTWREKSGQVCPS